MVHAALIADNNGQNPKADHVTERINLYAESFFIFGPVLFRPCYFSVKHIAQPGTGQKKNRPSHMMRYRAENPYPGKRKADICKHYCIIPKSKHLKISYPRKSLPHAFHALFPAACGMLPGFSACSILCMPSLCLASRSV